MDFDVITPQMKDLGTSSVPSRQGVWTQLTDISRSLGSQASTLPVWTPSIESITRHHGPPDSHWQISGLLALAVAGLEIDTPAAFLRRRAQP